MYVWDIFKTIKPATTYSVRHTTCSFLPQTKLFGVWEFHVYAKWGPYDLKIVFARWVRIYLCMFDEKRTSACLIIELLMTLFTIHCVCVCAVCTFVCNLPLQMHIHTHTLSYFVRRTIVHLRRSWALWSSAFLGFQKIFVLLRNEWMRSVKLVFPSKGQIVEIDDEWFAGISTSSIQNVAAGVNDRTAKKSCSPSRLDCDKRK